MQTRHGANGEIDAVGDLHACEQVVRICPDASTPGARSVSDRPPTLGRTPSDLTIANRRRIVGLSVQPARPRPCVCSLTSPPRTVRARPLVSPSKAPTGTASALAILTMIASDGLVRPASTLRTKSGARHRIGRRPLRPSSRGRAAGWRGRGQEPGQRFGTQAFHGDDEFSRASTRSARRRFRRLPWHRLSCLNGCSSALLTRVEPARNPSLDPDFTRSSGGQARSAAHPRRPACPRQQSDRLASAARYYRTYPTVWRQLRTTVTHLGDWRVNRRLGQSWGRRVLFPGDLRMS